MPRPNCTTSTKKRFPNRLEAELALADIHRSNSHHRHHRYREEPIRSFECDSCGGWHLTSMTLEEYENRRTVSD